MDTPFYLLKRLTYQQTSFDNRNVTDIRTKKKLA